MSEIDNIGRAIIAHLAWRGYLREAIETRKCPLNPDTAGSDQKCEFGKWFHGLPATHKVSAHWKEINALHAEFHALGIKILQLALTGHKQEATAEMALGSRFAAVMSQLLRALENWKTALSKGP